MGFTATAEGKADAMSQSKEGKRVVGKVNEV